MKITFGSVVVGAGLTGVFSFSCLTLAIGSEYWYIIEDKRTNHTDPPHMHSGLWGVIDGTLFLILSFLPLILSIFMRNVAFVEPVAACKSM